MRIGGAAVPSVHFDNGSAACYGIGAKKGAKGPPICICRKIKAAVWIALIRPKREQFDVGIP